MLYSPNDRSLFQEAIMMPEPVFTARCLLVSCLLLCLAMPAWGATLDASAVNGAEYTAKHASKGQLDPAVIKAEILLDRARLSPGDIDGKLGDSAKKALRGFAVANGLPASDGVTLGLWTKLVATTQEPVLTEYKITESDVKGPFLKTLPAKLEEIKTLKALSYSGPREEIAERFHMSEGLLAQLNPGKTFNKIGETITVANVINAPAATIGRVEVDKALLTVKVFDPSNALLAVFPASVGRKTTPTGTLKVISSDANPNYRYNPDYNFKGIKARKPFDIMPGPNNPVGSYWIGLSAEGYGIHGTPNPNKVGKTESHGCVRLTNWDVAWLGKNVKKGTQVVFIDK